ncbi:MAG: hypothetical protein RLZZ246_418 [Planctomycetota bacterium]
MARRCVLQVTAFLFLMAAAGVPAGAQVMPYRAVFFEGDIGPDRFEFDTTDWHVAASQACSRWPALGPNGDGLRFRLMDKSTVVGTYCVPNQAGQGWLTGARAATWRLGSPGSRSDLPLSPGMTGSIASDGNAQGGLVGAVIEQSPANASAVRAAVWDWSPIGDSASAPRLMAHDPAWGDCGLDGVSTWFTAVSPAEGDTGAAAAALAVGSLGSGLVCAGGVCVVPADGPIGSAMRLRWDETDSPWCGSIGSAGSPSSEFAPRFSADRFTPLASLHDCSVLGSQRPLVGATMLCEQGQEWDAVAWSLDGDRVKFAEHCRCAASDCITHDADQGVWSRVTEIRLDAFLAGSTTLQRPAIAGGCFGYSTWSDTTTCYQQDCPQVRAYVQTDPLSTTGASEFLDLHSVIAVQPPLATACSAVASVTTRPLDPIGQSQAWSWMVLGLVANDLWSDQDIDDALGALWLSRIEAGELEWCFVDANHVSLRASDWTIQALHDATENGVVVAVARRGSERRLCYLTSAADLNGDLAVDGADLGILLTVWGLEGDAAGDQAPLDLNADSVVDGADLGILITGWTGERPVEGVRVALDCDEGAWRQATVRLPFVAAAAELLGFDGLDGLGESLVAAAVPERESICGCVSLLATALEGANHD